jgi:hypothetical protein
MRAAPWIVPLLLAMFWMAQMGASLSIWLAPSLALGVVWAFLNMQLLSVPRVGLHAKALCVVACGVLAILPYANAAWSAHHWHSELDGEPNLVWLLGGPVWLLAVLALNMIWGAMMVVLSKWRRRAEGTQ